MQLLVHVVHGKLRNVDTAAHISKLAWDLGLQVKDLRNGIDARTSEIRKSNSFKSLMQFILFSV